HVVSPSLLDNLKTYNNHLRESGVESNSSGICRFSIMDFYIDMCSTNIIAGFEPVERYRWIDVGKPDSLRKAEVLFTRP
ncbi:MAG: hypothetical protein K2M12_06380, partial [Muribaculaceae bacterium]|nr:hypothetical protein [Muribaculaceae bacterium]